MPIGIQNIVLPAMEFYFDRFDSNGLPTGEREFGDTSEFSITVEPAIVEDYSGTGAIGLLQVYTQVRKKITANLTIKNMATENLGIYFGADTDLITTAAGSVTGDPINGGEPLVGGRWYQLGKSAYGDSGVRNIADLDIVDGATPLTVDVDYLEDLSLGRIYVVAGGAAEGIVGTADYDTTVAQWERLSSNDLSIARGILRGKSNNTTGLERDLLGSNVSIIPTGSLAYASRDTVQQMQVEIAFLTGLLGEPPLMIDRRPV